MKRAKTLSNPPKLQGLIHCILVRYAQFLRRKYPQLKIRNKDVFASGIREMARLGYIELVDGTKEIPDWLPDWLVRTVKRVKYHPIWMFGPRFPDNALMELRLRPRIKDGRIVWRHTPSKTAHKRWQSIRQATARINRRKRKRGGATSANEG